jgi:hypothetical protein
VNFQTDSKQAIEDIKSFDMQVKFEEEISSTKTIDVGVHLFFVIPTMLVVRGLLGFGLALSAQTAAPQFVRWIT